MRENNLPVNITQSHHVIIHLSNIFVGVFLQHPFRVQHLALAIPTIHFTISVSLRRRTTCDPMSFTSGHCRITNIAINTKKTVVSTRNLQEWEIKMRILSRYGVGAGFIRTMNLPSLQKWHYNSGSGGYQQ